MTIKGIILADSTNSIVTTGQSPFDGRKMIDVGSQNLQISVHIKDGCFHLAHTLYAGFGTGVDALAIRRLLFGSHGEHTSLHMTDITAVVAVVSTWQVNVQYLENRFNSTRHEAIADPSLRTFHPLTLLHRNIADLENALVAAGRRMKSITRTWTLTKSERALELFGAQYDALHDRLNAVSVRLNNEIQLVIGAVTVQVGILPLLLARVLS
jgi:hypothetical protein